MQNTRKLAILAAAIAVIGLGGLAWTQSIGQAPQDTQGENNPTHDSPQQDDGHAHAEGGDEGHEEQEGSLHLSATQIEAAGVQLVAAAPMTLGTAISFPGEIRFDEDHTAHVVPRVPGVVESVHADLGQPVKRGQVRR